LLLSGVFNNAQSSLN